ncbi:hypothetical protein Hanom_Chr06g00561641 [Helianthus anomalus]
MNSTAPLPSVSGRYGRRPPSWPSGQTGGAMALCGGLQSGEGDSWGFRVPLATSVGDSSDDLDVSWPSGQTGGYGVVWWPSVRRK